MSSFDVVSKRLFPHYKETKCRYLHVPGDDFAVMNPQLINRGSTGLLLWVKVHAAPIDGVQERVAVVKWCVQRVRPWLLVEDLSLIHI